MTRKQILGTAIGVLALILVLEVWDPAPAEGREPDPALVAAIEEALAARGEGAPAPAEPQSEADRLIEVLESYSVLTAAGQKAGEGAIYHLVMSVIGIATILIVTGDHRLGNRFFPGAGRVRRRGERLRAVDDVPWDERESQHRNETHITCARIIGASIVLGFTLS